MGWVVTPSQKFLLFWLIFIFGLVVGSYFTVSLHILIWLGVLWLLLLASGQEEKVEITCLVATAFLGGWLVWQLTGGETWIKTDLLIPVSSKLAALRELIIDRIFFALPEPHGSLLSGIILGNRTKLDRELLDTFRTVGLTHLIAVSGYNLSVLTINLLALTRPILGRKSIFLALIVIVAFVILTGAPASILRAGVMASTLLVAHYLGRPGRSINILIFATAVLAAIQPKIIFDVGFQLSVAATYGLIRLTPIITTALERLTRLPEIIRLIIGEALAATLITAPILIAYFERISLVSPLSNLLILPIMPLLMGLGILSIFLLFTAPSFGKLFALLSWPLLEWIVQVSNFLSRISWAATPVALDPPVSLGLIIVLVISTEILSFKFRQRIDDPLISFKMIRA